MNEIKIDRGHYYISVKQDKDNTFAVLITNKYHACTELYDDGLDELGVGMTITEILNDELVKV